MSKQALGVLAKDYAKGTIAKDSYRKSRTTLIQGIVAGEIEIKAIDYEPPLKPSNEIEEAITEGIKRDETQMSSQKPAKKNSSPAIKKEVKTAKKSNQKFPLVFISISVVLVLSLIVAVFLFYPKPPNSEVAKTAIKTGNVKNSPVTTVTSNTSLTGESLIADFLSEKNWSEDSIDDFISSWSTLSDQEKNTAKQTKRMQRMNDSIYKQFLEGKALASIDSTKSLIKQQKLIEFASAIGINDSRLVLD